MVSSAIWVSDAQFGKYAGLQSFHRLGLFVAVDMVVPGEVEQPVDDKVRRVGLESDALLRRLARAGFMRKSDVAEHDWRAIRGEHLKLVPLEHREGEHVGRLVSLPPLAIKGVDLRVRSEQHAGDKARVGEQRLPLARSGSSACRERLPVTGRPVFDIDVEFHARAP